MGAKSKTRKKNYRKKKQSTERNDYKVKRHLLKKTLIVAIAVFFTTIILAVGLKLYSDISNREMMKRYFLQVNYKFSNVSYVSDQLFMGEYNGKWFIFKAKNGQLINKKGFERVLPEKEGLIAIMEDGKWGFIDTRGQEVIKLQFANVGNFIDGRCAVYTGKGWGVIDKTGKYLIRPDYDEININSERYICVKKGNKWGIFDLKNKKIILNPTYQDIVILKYPQAAIAKEKDNYYLLKLKDSSVEKMDVKFTDYKLNVDRWLPVKIKDKWHLLDLKTMKVTYSKGYEDIWGYEEGYLQLRQARKFYIFTANGNLLEREFNINSLLIPAGKYLFVNNYNGKITVIDLMKSRIIRDFDAEEIISFDNELLALKRKNKWGVFTKNGKEIIEQKYDAIWQVFPDLYAIELNKKWGLLKANGGTVGKIEYDLIGQAREGLISVLKNGKWGVIDKNGMLVLKNQYDQISIVNKDVMIAREKSKWFVIVVDKPQKNQYSIRKFKIEADNAYYLLSNVVVYSKDSSIRVLIPKTN